MCVCVQSIYTLVMDWKWLLEVEAKLTPHLKNAHCDMLIKTGGPNHFVLRN